jgi:flavin reductase (DIM6/NTAB) family NADH-FMN oxidoreductase RutF
MVSSQPPVVIFSPARRVRDNSTKHTLQNIGEVPEVVINICDYEMVQQVSLASCEFPKQIDEFVKTGFTKQAALHIKPPMVKEAKVKLECKVLEIKPLGNTGGAGNLVIAEILSMHIDESILNEDHSMIDQRKLHQVARLGGNWYCVVNEANLFQVPKPNVQLGIGVDALPESIRNSTILTGNNLGMLANVNELPVIDASFEDDKLKNIFQYYSLTPDEMEKELHTYAKELLEQQKVQQAWQVLLSLE